MEASALAAAGLVAEAAEASGEEVVATGVEAAETEMEAMDGAATEGREAEHQLLASMLS